MFLYLAAPLFTPIERQFNAHITSLIEQHVPIFLPQRDGSLLADMLAAGVALEVAERRVYQQDLQAMRKAFGLVAVLDGAHVDEGVAFELGFMASLGRVCIGLQTDIRRALPTGNNPMLAGALQRVFSSAEELAGWIGECSMEARFGTR